MIRKYGRPICFLALVALWAPFLGSLAKPDSAPPAIFHRTTAKFPDKPINLLEWLKLPGKLEGYINDNFGFRYELVTAYSTLRFKLRSPVNKRIAFGRNGWVYYAEEEIFEQSRGQVMRRSRLSAFADLAAKLERLVSARGGKFLVAIPPNQHTLGFENLPLWALQFDGPTEYDVMIGMLAERGVPAVDLRPVLEAGKAIGPVYRPRDTHWSRLGALLAFNAITGKLGYDDWIINPADVYRGEETVTGGLSIIAGVSTVFSDINTEIVLAGLLPVGTVLESTNDFPPLSTYTLRTSNSGDPVTIIGDSFSRLPLRDYFSVRTSRLFWTHFRNCGFDWNLVAANLPSTVILMPTERLVGCEPGKAPANLPPLDQSVSR